ncbi:MAG: methyltransferase domain-containing protein [Candidatus Acidiferrales bacterium]|jgi:SAM-dependent methyltransferase
MTNGPPELSEVKRAMKSAWMAGDFGEVARLTLVEGAEFVSRLGLKPGMRVLDVACGTGNQSLPAARTRAEVTGLDIAPNLLEQARARAQEEGLKIRFIEGDAEELPFEKAEFDVVMSMFGAMFAPRPERVVAEFLRVCRPGGLIAMANWTPEGFTGQMFKITSGYAPPAPGVPPPVLWGDEKTVRERFGAKVRIETAKRQALFEWPFGPAEVVQFFRTYFGPTQTAFARLDAAGQKALAEELTKHWASHNEGDPNHTVVHPEYLEVHARVV